MRGLSGWALFAMGACGCFLCPSASGHDFTFTQVVAVIKADGSYLIDMRLDVDALALGVPSTVPSAEIAAALRALSPNERDRAIEQARDTLRRRVRIRFDGRKAAPTVTFPEHDHPLNAPGAEPTVLGTTARLSGRYPDGATHFTFGASRAFNAVHLTILDEVSAGGVQDALGAGQDSAPYRLHEAALEPRRFVVGRYLVLGFEHILPKGLDHIVFVLGLYLLSARFRPLLLQVTAFTVAHSVTLALSLTGVASLPSGIVEPLIAVSILYVGVENLCVRDLKPWRPAVVFLFGLLHGMGFAGVLHELGLPDGQVGSALVGFNVGVELGQLAVVAIAFGAVGWFRDRAWYRAAIIRPLSFAIAVAGLYWAVQRTLAE